MQQEGWWALCSNQIQQGGLVGAMLQPNTYRRDGMKTEIEEQGCSELRVREQGCSELREREQGCSKYKRKEQGRSEHG